MNDIMDQRLAQEEDVRRVGRFFSSSAGRSALKIVHNLFGSKLSYTRGDTHHTAFLEGQKSVVEFITNAAIAVQNEEKGE